LPLIEHPQKKLIVVAMDAPRLHQSLVQFVNMFLMDTGQGAEWVEAVPAG
jgi:hypothetical protein